jgi:hypothetical protein
MASCPINNPKLSFSGSVCVCVYQLTNAGKAGSVDGLCSGAPQSRKQSNSDSTLSRNQSN